MPNKGTVLHVMEKIRKALGQRIRTLRKAKNLTQEELAEKAGLSYKFIGETERGKANPSIESFYKIAEGMEVSVATLFGEENDEEIFYKLSREELEVVKDALGILGKLFHTRP